MIKQKELDFLRNKIEVCDEHKRDKVASILKNMYGDSEQITNFYADLMVNRGNTKNWSKEKYINLFKIEPPLKQNIKTVFETHCYTLKDFGVTINAKGRCTFYNLRQSEPIIKEGFLKLPKTDFPAGVDNFKWVKKNIKDLVSIVGEEFNPLKPDKWLEDDTSEGRYIRNTFKRLSIPEAPIKKSKNYDKNVAIFKEHIKKVLCSGYKDPELGEEYGTIIIDYFSYMFQKIGEKVKWSIVIVSEQGLGKTSLIDFFYKLLGNKNVGKGNNETFISRFNDYVNKFICFFVDDFKVKGEEIYDKLKPLITDKLISSNRKFKDHSNPLNFTNYIFFSNKKDFMKFEPSDRRLFILHCDLCRGLVGKAKKDEFKNKIGMGYIEYFARLHDYLIQDDENFGDIRYYLANRKISPDFETSTCPPSIYKSQSLEIIAEKDDSYSVIKKYFENSIEIERDGYFLLNNLREYIFANGVKFSYKISKILSSKGYIRQFRINQNTDWVKYNPNHNEFKGLNDSRIRDKIRNKIKSEEI